MAFDVGDKVVYPHHGAAVIERRERRDAFGADREYLVLRLAYGDLTLMVPADNTDEVGLREVINDEEVEEVQDPRCRRQGSRRRRRRGGVEGEGRQGEPVTGGRGHRFRPLLTERLPPALRAGPGFWQKSLRPGTLE